MKATKPSKQPDAISFNETVEKVYKQLLKKTKQLIATLDTDTLRSYLERPMNDGKSETVIHELVHPLCYLRLEHYVSGIYAIHFGIEQFCPTDHYSEFTSTFIRMVFKSTDCETTQLNIERCVMTNWCISNCSDMYEYVLERNKYHVEKTIAYKVITPTAKKTLTVAS
ncbi:hypothetical protein KXD93_16575 [Mucilaginibacter sp. BJC16-A38]|uniref:hypothetical protein n=1 Tax=Mucilaginibacter phenanthrenivorans TaxID=1234842 RepID=UPI002157E946|nr:hypothetical protein [Mucilaginibacter phenanthrenivorans]MCR8559274.1 hypothetical protein [Mucilaginibacter phenanthrenivorans]